MKQSMQCEQTSSSMYVCMYFVYMNVVCMYVRKDARFTLTTKHYIPHYNERHGDLSYRKVRLPPC